MKKRVITILFIAALLLAFMGCTFFCGDRLNTDWYKLLQSSAAVGDTVEVVYVGALECDPDIFHNYGHFGGLSAWGGELFSVFSFGIASSDCNSQSCRFTVPPKAVSTNFLFDKDLFIEYPEILTYSKEGNKVTVKSEKAFFNTNSFCKEKAKILLDNGYPLVWLDGEGPKSKSLLLDNISLLKGSGNYDLDTITPYQVTFTIPSWFKGGKIHIVNENGYVYGVSWLGDTKIAKTDFDDILSKISDEDKSFLQDKYSEKDGFYSLNDDFLSGDGYSTSKYLIKILRQAGYYDTHVLNIEPDPLDPHAFFASKEKLTVD